jgi:hypothetical protein
MVARLPMAVFAAALLLFGQFAACAHSHPDELTRATSERVAFTAPAQLCALCLLAFHSPASASALPVVENPQPVVEVAQPAVRPGYHSLHFGSSLTRAPPFSV